MAKIKKFGTFGGVFTPSILTILGVIMYMRLPMIAGEAGLIGTLGIVLIAHLISITTGLSVSSIATDKKVKEGGTYYIISRSLGLPIGGTLGLALFVGLSFSVSLYLIGFAESFLGYWDMPMDINHIRIAGSIILVVVTIITLISTSLAIKAQYLIMTAIFLSLLSILFGSHEYAPEAPNFFGSGTGVSLIVLFGIFFPAVTGFEAGVSMSGDLKDPKKSIPGGTIAAIAIGLAVYIGLAFFFAYTVDGSMLASDPQALFKISLIPQLVIAGIWGATLSSALGSILAAPRILQSTALDKITPRVFAKGSGASKEPRNALILTFLIAEAGILIGELDVIARIVSVFFITTYGFLNLSAAFESLTSADFRPSFKTPAWISIVGALACGLVMVQLDFVAMIGAVVILGSVFILLKRRQLVLETGDAWSSVWATLVKFAITRLKKKEMHTRNWRPNIILFSGPDKARPYLIEFAKSFAGRLGIFSSFELVPSKEKQLIKDKRYFTSFTNKDDLIIHQHKCRDIYSGMDEIARVYGFEGVEPNTILMGWSKNEKHKAQFLKLIKNLAESDFNTIFLNYNAQKEFGEKRTIDIWWSGWGNNLTFAIFLLRHFTAEGDWKDSKIRLLVINNVQSTKENIDKSLQTILNNYRVNFEVKIINNASEKLSREAIISRESAQADLTFIGIPDKEFHQLDEAYDEVLKLTKNLGTFFLINSSSNFETFDIGTAGVKESEKMPLIEEKLDLPALQPSKYDVINEDIEKIDINGQKVLNLFIEKSITPVFSELYSVADNLESIVYSVFSQVDKLENLDDAYRRTKTLIKIKNDFYFRTNRVYADLAENKLAVQKEMLESGINWYIRQLEQDLQKFPLKLRIPYLKEDLALKKSDPLRLKWFKLRRRLTHPFARKTINGRIRYLEIATYYLHNNRHYFLSAFLTRLQEELVALFAESKSLIIIIDELLEQTLDRVKMKKGFLENTKDKEAEIEQKIEKLKASITAIQNQARNRMLLEFRKNLQLMSNDMEKADINFRIRRKRRKDNYYKELIKRNTNFASSWYEATLHQVNKIYLDLMLQSYHSRIKDKINELNLKISLQLESRYKNDLQTIREKLNKLEEDLDDVAGIKIGTQSFEENITLLKDFDELGEEILKLTASLPETIEIANDREETENENTVPLNVPLRKITRFYIDSRFLGPTHDELENISQSLKSSIFLTQDLLSLTRFNLDNIPEDLPDKMQVISPIINDTCQKIKKEEENISQISESINKLFEKNLQEVFNQLSAYKIPATVAEYSQFIREHQGKKVLKTVDTYFDNLKNFVNRTSAKLLYSRSEGILLAKKILESENMNSVNQKILDLVEQVNPKKKVVDLLPQYYKNLFSGRSNISEDFWVKRPKDEELFKTAVRRYQLGYKGGIMLLGDRNSGKSAFCSNIAKKLFKKDKVHHIYPLPNGSSSADDFMAELRKAINETGDIEEIMATLPQGTVFIIHDLELWWERSNLGWDVVKLLSKIINEYSSKILFVVNMNNYAFELMNKIVNLQNEFISVITLMPFDSKELQEMIIRRHRSSGMKFILVKKHENDMSAIQMASLFNKYFDYSEGNPGSALKAWMGNISKVSADTLHIVPPHIPDSRILADMDENWKIVLVQIILHKWMTKEKIKKIFNLDEEKAQNVISSLLRTGLVNKRNEDIYTLNTYISSQLIRVFKKEGLL
ncbi:MAG TPA: hypothetical protein VIN10_05210 [Bacteroidales bacterium]